MLQDGWLKTGDLGRFDEDGFLFIEGRLSRFSKIGGEMVPHETVEQKILAALELGKEATASLRYVGADPQKGEALVLLSTIEIDQAKLRAQLHDAGVPNSGSENQSCGSSKDSGAGDRKAGSAQMQRAGRGADLNNRGA